MARLSTNFEAERETPPSILTWPGQPLGGVFLVGLASPSRFYWSD
jgi:hypothetical protein